MIGVAGLRFTPTSKLRLPTMSVLQKISAAALLVLLALAGYGLWETRPLAGAVPRSTSAARAATRSAQPDGFPAIDQATLSTAQKLAQLATAPEERAIAQAAVQSADHELDIAFAAALHAIEAHPPVLSAEAQKIEARLLKSQQLLDADQAAVAQLTAALGQASGTQQSTLQDRLDLAKSQLELDQDEVEEANQDLAEAGGNVHQRIQTMMQQHSASEQKPSAAQVGVSDPLANLRGMARRVRHWMQLRARQRSVDAARALVVGSIATLGAERHAMAAQLEASKGSVPALAQHTKRARGGDAASAPAPAASAPAPAAAAPVPVPAAAAPVPAAAANDAASLLAKTRQIASDQRLLTFLDERIENRKDLVDQYGKWSGLLGARSAVVLHASLVNGTVVVGILLLLLFLDRWLEKLFGRTRLDRRQIGTLRTVTRVALQVVGVAIMLLVLIGLPGQIGTMLGIVGAGLTVALKDFIVAFIGWLILMGKNGMRLGDWVEINGVSGEVVDLGVFHTILLETGNWNDAARPTGRRVTFANSFAIQGHYFNFSTSGQWLWDEVLILVPYERDPHVIADAIHKEALAATADTARDAEQEWRRAVRTQRDSGFSAAPGVIVRPAYGGVEVAVRYITRASERVKLRTRLYQTAVQLLGRSAAA